MSASEHDTSGAAARLGDRLLKLTPAPHNTAEKPKATARNLPLFLPVGGN
jgi:hypothetical protein